MYRRLALAFFWLFYIHSCLSAIEKSNQQKFLYEISIATVFKDEAPYFKEWIEYHKLLGVQHFRLYNNDSTDDFLKVLEPYIKSGEVQVIDWPGGHGDWCNKVQGLAMLDAMSNLKGISKWLAIIDVDEFILPKIGNLIAFLSDYEAFGGVVINWQNYGTSWVQDLPPGKLLIETLTLKAEEQSWWNEQVKSIVQLDMVDSTKHDWRLPHQWLYLKGYSGVAPNMKPFVYGKIDISKIRINHYVHRTENYFYNHKLAKKARMQEWPSPDFVENWHKSCNKVEDKEIFRFVPIMRNKIFNLKTP